MDLSSHIKNKPFIQLLVLCIITMALYATSVRNEFLLIDDDGLVKGLLRLKEWSIIKHFFPEKAGGLYYRPLTMASYVFDRFVFNASSVWMHLHNILIHLLNVFLVWGIARTFVRYCKMTDWAPFFASLLFAVHPLATESINWVSGRTDLLTTFFVLLSLWFLLLYRFQHRYVWLLPSAVAFSLSVLAKETALAFLPGALLLLVVRLDSSRKRTLKEIRHFWFNAGVSFLFIGAAGIFFWFRFLGISTNNSQIGNTLRLLQNDFLYDVMVVLRAFGFYMKKLVAPWPLNFTIVEVDPVYELFAVPLLIAVVVLVFVKWDLLSGLFAAGLCMFAPAFIIAFNQIAWTPYAERYLYITTALIVLPMVVWLFDITFVVGSRHWKPAWLVLPLMILAFSVTTLQRNFVWRSNYSILSDSVQKSPYSFNARLGFGEILVKRGELEKAEEHLQFAKKLDQLWYDERPDIELSKIRVQQERYDEAIDLFVRVIERTRGRSIVVWNNIEAMLAKTSQLDDRVKTRIYDHGPAWSEEYERPELAQGLASLAIRYRQADVARDYLNKVFAWAEKSRAEEKLLEFAETELQKLNSTSKKQL